MRCAYCFVVSGRPGSCQLLWHALAKAEKARLIHRWTGNPRAVQLLLAPRKIESTVTAILRAGHPVELDAGPANFQQRPSRQQVLRNLCLDAPPKLDQVAHTFSVICRFLIKPPALAIKRVLTLPIG